ncbi:hypothetical protein EC968_010139 [Mortierella alpina]|nr:hypothetical protein EC968_010139 [Mortierella alpina]
MDPNATRSRACKHYHYESDKGNTTVEVIELLDADFGLYVWPSSLVLAEYVHHRLDIFTGSTERPRVILELGAGTALPSLLLAKTPSCDSRFLITTDRADVPEILDNVRDAFRKNGIRSFFPEDTEAKVMVRGLNWGDFSLANARNADGGLLQLLDDVSQIKCTKDGSVTSQKIDIILGSDTFYNPPDFEPLLATVSYIINRHNPDCVFLSTYQNRSAKRNIDHLLLKWGLEGRLIDWEDFGFDMGKFVTEDGDDCEVNTTTASEGSDSDSEGVQDPYSDDDERWLRLAKQEVSHDMATAPGLSADGPKLSLVNYSSDSENENETECVMDTNPCEGNQRVDSDKSTSKDMNSDAPEEGNAFWAQKSALEQRYQIILDKVTPHTKERWAFTGVVLLIYFIRVFFAQGWYIVTYALGIYLLNLFLAFLQPKIDPSLEMDMEADSVEEGGPMLPTRSDEEFRPFVRRLPEFKFWHSATRSIVIAFGCTLFRIFDIPVFWPILLVYFCILFTLTMKRQIRHMIKYRYIPFNIGKKSYGNGSKSFT